MNLWRNVTIAGMSYHLCSCLLAYLDTTFVGLCLRCPISGLAHCLEGEALHVRVSEHHLQGRQILGSNCVMLLLAPLVF